jgi:SAM-dependent methyltransferase
VGESAVWHDVECGGYRADLPLWRELAAGRDEPLLELGCGTGRVALDLARAGHRVWGIDIDSELIAELRRRAAAEGLEVRGEPADAARFALAQRFGLIVAPMQLVQLLGGAEARRSCLAAAGTHLAPGGLVALAIVEEPATGVPGSAPLPDVRERAGWVYSSLPLGAREADGALVVERLRQTVDPQGRMSEDRDSIRLQVLAADQLECEAATAGLRPAGRRRIEQTEAHVGSTVVLLEGP